MISHHAVSPIKDTSQRAARGRPAGGPPADRNFRPAQMFEFEMWQIARGAVHAWTRTLDASMHVLNLVRYSTGTSCTCTHIYMYVPIQTKENICTMQPKR